MRIVFMGTPEFAVPCLDALASGGYDVVGVVTSTDKMGGRGKKKRLESAVKKYAVSKGLNVLQPPRLKRQEFIDELKALKADLQVVVAFRMLPEIVWNMPPLGTVNLHASLLPQYRGAAPINWAIINGEKETGLTTFKLKHEIDTGNILYQHKMNIGAHETAGELHDRMMDEGARLILKTVQAIESGKAESQEQSEREVTHAPKIFHEDCCIDFNQPVQKVHDFIRGLSPYPCAWTILDDLQFNIIRSIPAESTFSENAVSGELDLSQKGRMFVKCQDKWLEVLQGQLQGRKRMTIKDLLNGYTPQLKRFKDC